MRGAAIAAFFLTQPAAAQEEVFHFYSPADVIAVTHGGAPPLPLSPTGIRALPKDRLGKSMVLVALLRDSSGKVVGTATEQEFYPAGADHTKPWQAWWTLQLPGRGTIANFETEAVPADQQPLFTEMRRTGKAWSGSKTARIANGPAPSGDGVIMGGSGDWAGARGLMSEWTTLTHIAPGGVLEGRIELRIRREDK